MVCNVLYVRIEMLNIEEKVGFRPRLQMFFKRIVSGTNMNSILELEHYKNGVEINEIYGQGKFYSNFSPTWIFSLNKGDTIRLKIYNSLYTDSNRWRTFSGKLLQKLA